MRRAHAQVIKRNNDLIRHFRQEQQELKQPDDAPDSEHKGGHHKSADMPAAAQPSRNKLMPAMAATAQDVLTPGDMHSGVDRQAEASSAVRVAGALISSAAHAGFARGAPPAGAATASAGAPGAATDRRKMKLTFILVGTNAHLMHALQLKKFRTQVLLHSQFGLDPGITGLQSLSHVKPCLPARRAYAWGRVWDIRRVSPEPVCLCQTQRGDTKSSQNLTSTAKYPTNTSWTTPHKHLTILRLACACACVCGAQTAKREERVEWRRCRRYQSPRPRASKGWMAQ